MKIKTSYLIYAVIGTVFAGLSMFTDIFEKGNFEAIFSNLGMIIGFFFSGFNLIHNICDSSLWLKVLSTLSLKN